MLLKERVAPTLFIGLQQTTARTIRDGQKLWADVTTIPLKFMNAINL